MSKKSAPLPTKAKFYYVKPDDYEPKYVNGIYGGISPKGELMCHFFMEYTDVPLEEIVPLTEGGEPIPEETVKKLQMSDSNDIVPIRREVRTGIIIPPQQIRSFASWMINHLEKSGIEVKKVDEENDE